jgi:hypothetical protein
MSDREARKGENESWFREVNERLEDRVLEARGFDPDATMEIVCECAREECTERVAISLADYEQVRTSPLSFIVLPGHAELDYERVLASGAGYEVVEKLGDAALAAEAEDPRGSS